MYDFVMLPFQVRLKPEAAFHLHLPGGRNGVLCRVISGFGKFSVEVTASNDSGMEPKNSTFRRI